MKGVLVFVAILGLGVGPAAAQVDLPGAAAAHAAKPARKPRPRADAASADPAALIGKTLRLNGRHGALELAHGDDDALKIVKYVLPGEVVSNPAQSCRIDIVSETPIAALPKGEPDGLPRYAADIPACPLTFDVVDGGVLVPAQANACVFSTADCQASPSGLWGPPASELDAKAISKARAAADRAIQDSQRKLERRDSDAAGSLAREQSDFAAERDDLCQGYDGETRLGFCASRLTQTRAALLSRRVAEAAPEPAARRKRKKRAP